MARTALSGLKDKFHKLESQSKGFPVEYQRLRLEAERQESEGKYSTKASTSYKNLPRNRYRDVLTYDHSRIHLMTRSDDYINASLVPISRAGRKYILAQGPLSHTCEHFWQMIWEQDSHMVVMLNRLYEKNTPKCHKYFPTEGADSQLTFGQFELTLVSEEQRDHFVMRQVRLRKLPDTILNGETDQTDSSELSAEPPRIVTHFQFVTWPDFGVPRSTDDFLEFLQEVRSSGLLDCSRYGPAVVHCSAGIGRSGTFVIVDTILVLSQMPDVTEEELDIYKLVLELRQYRMGLIQTHDQMRFCWQAVIDAVEEPKWSTLLSLTCVTSSPKRRRSFNREVGNQLTSGDSFISVDNSELVGSPRKRSRVSVPCMPPHSANDLKSLDTPLAEEEHFENEDEESERTQTDDDDDDGSGKETPKETEPSKETDSGRKRRERQERIDKMRAKMRKSEQCGLMDGYGYYLVYGALAVIGGFVAFYFTR